MILLLVIPFYALIAWSPSKGKTETAKLLCTHLVSTAHSHSKSTANAVEKRLLKSATILEAFGNAKTVQCPSSSRFVNYTKVYVDCSASSDRGVICGALIETFLLDESRVTSLSDRKARRGGRESVWIEQNYNIFYEVLSAWDEIGRREVDVVVDVRSNDLLWGNEYRLITRPDMSQQTLSQADWQKRFGVTEDALAAMGCDDITIGSLWSVLAGIILMGELSFIELDSFEGALAQLDEPSVNTCYTMCRVLGIESGPLVEMLTQRVMVARGESFVMAMSQQEACKARDAICRALYSHVFASVVSIVNRALLDDSPSGEAGKASRAFIGIVDMFGVEQSDSNGLEQLLINYSNEVMQNEFNKHIFENEVELFEDENIECPLDLSACPSNALCVDMIFCPHSGGKNIFSILETAGRCPKPTDAKFCWELHKTFEENHGNAASKHHHSFDRFFPSPHHKDKRSSFIIRHFMGNVHYTVGTGSQWVLGNVDSTPDALADLMRSSDLQILHSFSLQGGTVSDGGSDGNSTDRITRRASPTMSSKTATSVRSLADTIQSTERSYILCIKPNESLNTEQFDHKYVLRQIRSLNCVKACEIMKTGLPERISYADVKELWSGILNEVGDLLQGEDDGAIVSLMLHALGISSQTYKLGKSMLFLEKGGLLNLRAVSVRSTEEVANLIFRFQKTLLGKRECQSFVEELANDVSVLERVVADGKTELNALQDKITTSTSSQEGSGTSIALSITLNDMHSSVDSASCLIALAESRINSLVPASIEFEKGEVASLVQMLAEQKASIDTLLADAKKMESACNSGLSSRLQEGALERWQTITKMDELVQSARRCVSDVEIAASRCQLDLSREIIRKCRNLIASTEDSLVLALESARDAIGQVDGAKTEHSALIRDMEHISDRSEVLSEVVNTLMAKCEAMEKKHKSSEDLAPKDKSGFPLSSEPSQTSRDMRRAGSMRLTRQDSLNLLREGGGGGSVDLSGGDWALRRGAANVDIDSDDDFAPIVFDMWMVPEGWEEVFDVQTQLPYYFNTITRMSQWDRPAGPAQSVGGQLMVDVDEDISVLSSRTSSTASTSTHNRSHRRLQNSTIDLALAEMKLADFESPSVSKAMGKLVKTSGTVCFNLEETESFVGPPDDIMISGQDNADAESALVESKENVVQTASESEAVANVVTSSPSLQRSDSNGAFVIPGKVTTKCSLSYGRITISQLDRMGIEIKRGFLLAREGFLSKWKKRYFVLEGVCISCYKTIDDYYNGTAVTRALTLSPSSVTAYTNARFTFSIKSQQSGGKSGRQEEWLLVAESEESMRQWVAYINAHIHYLQRNMDVSVYDSNVLTSDRYWLEGVVETCYWRLPQVDSEGISVVPLPVLSMPTASAPRTGETIFPGEYLEVVQIIDVEGHLFLRLADDRGWAKVWHPKNIGNLLVRARECVFSNVSYRVVVDDEQVANSS